MSRAHLRFFAAIAAVAGVCGLVATATAASAIPSSFLASSFSATNARDWWVSGTISCRFKHRCLALVRTLNGGRSFTRVPVPTLADVAGNGVAQVRFADPRHGYLGGTRFWSTSDGGHHWRVVNLGGAVGSVAVGGGFVYVTVSNPTRGFLMRSPIGRDDWTVLAEGSPYFEGVTVDNGVVLTDREVNAGGEQQILVSHDQGATFTASQPPLFETSCDPEEPAPDVVWMLCRGGMMDGLYRSTDGGFTFSPPPGLTVGSQNSSGVWPGSTTLGAASATTAVLGGQQLFRTTNGGSIFKRVPLPVAAGGWDVAFMNDRQGLALGGFGQSAYPAGRLYYTADGGASYHRVRL
jgi:hypothetical protein